MKGKRFKEAEPQDTQGLQAGKMRKPARETERKKSQRDYVVSWKPKVEECLQEQESERFYQMCGIGQKLRTYK